MGRTRSRSSGRKPNAPQPRTRRPRQWPKPGPSDLRAEGRRKLPLAAAGRPSALPSHGPAASKPSAGPCEAVGAEHRTLERPSRGIDSSQSTGTPKCRKRSSSPTLELGTLPQPLWSASSHSRPSTASASFRQANTTANSTTRCMNAIPSLADPIARPLFRRVAISPSEPISSRRCYVFCSLTSRETLAKPSRRVHRCSFRREPP